MTTLIIMGCVTLMVALIARVIEGSWVAPAPFFSFMWGMYLLAASPFFLLADLPVMGSIWIWMGCVTVVAGSATVHLLSSSRRPPSTVPTVEDMRFPYLGYITAIGIILGIAELVYIFARRDFSVADVLSYAALVNMTTANRSDFIYSRTSEQPVFERILMSLLYTATIFGGLLFYQTKRKLAKVAGVLPIFFLFAVFSLYGSRMGALYGGSFWIAGYIAAHVFATVPGQQVSAGFLIRTATIAVVLLLGLSTLTQALRYSNSPASLDWFRMLADPFGFVAAFNIWFQDSGIKLQDFAAGARTFPKVVALINIDVEPAQAISVGFTASNIYTVFRDLIDDFGSIGALVFLFVYGVIGRAAFTAAARRSQLAMPVLITWFAFALTSFSVSIFFYTVTSVAVLLITVYFIAVHVRQVRAPSPST